MQSYNPFIEDCEVRSREKMALASCLLPGSAEVPTDRLVGLSQRAPVRKLWENKPLKVRF